MSRRPGLALGTVQLGMPYGIANTVGQPEPEQAYRILDTAWEEGIRTWDTAPGYGQSEALIGRYIRERGVRPAISTKLPSVWRTLGSAVTPRELESFVDEAVQSSRQRLHVESIDHYLLHDDQDFRVFGGSLVERLLLWKERGEIATLGLSAYEPQLAVQAIQEGVEVLQVPFNAVDYRFQAAIEAARAKDLTVFVRSVFLQGLFFLGKERAERTLGAGALVERLKTLSKAYGYGMAEMALCFARDESVASQVLIGAERVEQLRDSIRAYRAPTLPMALITAIREAAEGLPEEILNPVHWRELRGKPAAVADET